jgi:glyoxylase-like metal-dependent hydrolase (beta-lactamase superfamily II)
MKRSEQLPGAGHFHLEQLADGIHAAIHIDGGGAVCNSGIIDLGDLTLVFDAFLTPKAAEDLRAAANVLTGRPVDFVVNSHYHNDHVWGNQAFGPDARIISSTRSRQLLATAGMNELKWYAANSAERLESLRDQVKAARGVGEQSDLSLWIGYYEALVDAFPHLSIRLPTVTFESRLVIHGSQRAAELTTFEDAHTGSDTVLFLPGDGIIFMSDLLFVGCHPYLGDGDPLKLVGSLDELGKIGATTFAPGHGPVGTLDDLKLLTFYVGHCRETAAKLVEEGDTSADRLAEIEVPDRYGQWQQSMFYQTNIGFLCQLLTDASADEVGR